MEPLREGLRVTAIREPRQRPHPGVLREVFDVGLSGAVPRAGAVYRRSTGPVELVLRASVALLGSLEYVEGDFFQELVARRLELDEAIERNIDLGHLAIWVEPVERSDFRADLGWCIPNGWLVLDNVESGSYEGDRDSVC